VSSGAIYFNVSDFNAKHVEVAEVVACKAQYESYYPHSAVVTVSAHIAHATVQPSTVQPSAVESNTAYSITVQPSAVESNTAYSITVQPSTVESNTAESITAESDIVYNLTRYGAYDDCHDYDIYWINATHVYVYFVSSTLVTGVWSYRFLKYMAAAQIAVGVPCVIVYSAALVLKLVIMFIESSLFARLVRGVLNGEMYFVPIEAKA